MPTYDYRCKACGHEFELFQSMTAPVQRKCPACGKLKLERLIGTGAGVIFKGGGFYETDYRSDSYTKAAEAEKKAAEAKPAEAKAEGGGDKTGKTDAKATGTGDVTGTSKPASDTVASSREASKPPSAGRSSARRPAARSKPSKTTRSRRGGG